MNHEQQRVPRPTEIGALPGREPPIVLEAGRAERNYWRDLWRYRELFRDPRLARRRRALQADRHRRRLGDRASLSDDADSDLGFRPPRESADRRRGALSGHGFRRIAGLVPVSTILSEASNSLVGNANLIGKVYFPRIIVPISSTIAALVDFAINLVMLGALMLWFGFLPSWRIILLPAFVVLAILASLGPALLVAALNVKYRDFRYIIPFIIQLSLYASPVGFSSAAVPAEWRFWYSLNPIVGVIDGFRWCLLGAESRLYVPGLAVSVAITAVLLWLGISYFRRTERTFADLI